MIRFARLGRGSVHVLEAVAHDPVGAAQVREHLDRLQPAVVHTDLPPWAWDALARRPSEGGRVDPIEDAVARALPEAHPYALYQMLRQWAGATGADVSLLAATMGRAPRRAVWTLGRLLRREGLSGSMQDAVDEFRQQVLPRVPAVRYWYATRTGLVTARLGQVPEARKDTRHASEGMGAVAVLSYPEGPLVADLVGRGHRAQRF